MSRTAPNLQRELRERTELDNRPDDLRYARLLRSRFPHSSLLVATMPAQTGRILVCKTTRRWPLQQPPATSTTEQLVLPSTCMRSVNTTNAGFRENNALSVLCAQFTWAVDSTRALTGLQLSANTNQFVLAINVHNLGPGLCFRLLRCACFILRHHSAAGVVDSQGCAACASFNFSVGVLDDADYVVQISANNTFGWSDASSSAATIAIAEPAAVTSAHAQVYGAWVQLSFAWDAQFSALPRYFEIVSSPAGWPEFAFNPIELSCFAGLTANATSTTVIFEQMPTGITYQCELLRRSVRTTHALFI